MLRHLTAKHTSLTVTIQKTVKTVKWKGTNIRDTISSGLPTLTQLNFQFYFLENHIYNHLHLRK